MFPAIDHLVALTDDVGIFQHAVLDVPNRACGYCTDDVGRALLVACDFARRSATGDAATRLVRTYLSYLHDAQCPDGSFHGFMGYDRRWQDHCGSPDAMARAVWGLGYAEAHAPSASNRRVAGSLRAKALPVIGDLTFVRSRAYAILGLVHALDASPDDALAVRATLDGAAGAIADAYDACASPDWAWCEDELTYDNARLPEALLRAGMALKNERFTRIGLAMLEFYVAATVERGVYVPVGNNGWYRRGGEKARFGQQPLEASALVGAALAAYEQTGAERWLGVAQIGHRWFVGGNLSGVVLAQPGGGCCDGLDADGVNPNMGAESTLAFLSSAIALAGRGTESLRLAR